jgi:hypothetical protein
MPPTESPNQRLASILLGQPVQEWIAGQRTLGHTWRHISTALKDATNGQVIVTHEALRGWFEETTVV